MADSEFNPRKVEDWVGVLFVLAIGYVVVFHGRSCVSSIFGSGGSTSAVRSNQPPDPIDEFRSRLIGRWKYVDSYWVGSVSMTFTFMQDGTARIDVEGSGAVSTVLPNLGGTTTFDILSKDKVRINKIPGQKSSEEMILQCFMPSPNELTVNINGDPRSGTMKRIK